MAYRVTAKGGCWAMLPTAMWVGRKRVHQNFYFAQGMTLPKEVKPETIAMLLSNQMIEEVPDE